MAEATQNEINTPGAFISERHRNPAEMMAREAQGNYTWAGVCAIFATILFGILLAVLYFDWAALNPA